MPQSEKGPNSIMKNLTEKKKKNMGQLIFHKQRIYEISKILAYIVPEIWEVSKVWHTDGQMNWWKEEKKH